MNVSLILTKDKRRIKKRKRIKLNERKHEKKRKRRIRIIIKETPALPGVEEQYENGIELVCIVEIDG